MRNRQFDHGKQLRAIFAKYEGYFDMDVEKVLECVVNYNNMIDEMSKLRKEEKVINDFLVTLPKGKQIEAADIDRAIEVSASQFHNDFAVLENFANTVKRECVMDQDFFSFFEIPDLIVRKKITKKDYEGIEMLLLKVKKLYLFHKKQLLP